MLIYENAEFWYFKILDNKQNHFISIFGVIHSMFSYTQYVFLY